MIFATCFSVERLGKGGDKALENEKERVEQKKLNTNSEQGTTQTKQAKQTLGHRAREFVVQGTLTRSVLSRSLGNNAVTTLNEPDDIRGPPRSAACAPYRRACALASLSDLMYKGARESVHELFRFILTRGEVMNNIHCLDSFSDA